MGLEKQRSEMSYKQMALKESHLRELGETVLTHLTFF